MQPTWLLPLSWAALILGLVSAVAIVVDEFVGGYRQPVKVMELIWPVTALYFGPAAILAYWKLGRTQSPRWRKRHGNPPKRRRRDTVVIALCHCGSHCTLGAIIATVIILSVDVNIAGDTLWPEYIGDYLSAVAIGIAFRYSAEVETGARRMWAAMRTVACQSGLAVRVRLRAHPVHLVGASGSYFFPEGLQSNNPALWLIVQSGLVIAFFSAWPATSWLVDRGVKVKPRGTLE